MALVPYGNIQAVPNNNQDPLISFEVDTARSSPLTQSSSLEQYDALKLYESILKTIRKFGE